MQLPVLSHNSSIDNNKMTIDLFKDKLMEEANEVLEAKSTEHLAEEILDVVQVCIGMLDNLDNRKGLKIQAAVNKHLKKLSKRGWNIKKLILINPINWEGK